MVSQTRPHPTCGRETELIGLEFELECPQGGTLYPQYAIALHAWFLDQVRQLDPKLSAQLHDNQQEKSFALSGLNGRITSSGKQLLLAAGETYRWYVSAFSAEVVEWMQEWMAVLPDTKEAYSSPEYMGLVSSLVLFAPYCGTGHKTTFGLGQTRLGWRGETIKLPSSQQLLAQRIEDLTAQLMATQKRPGGDRAWNPCEIRATILARQEFGESLQEIATDLEMPYETVKTYGKLARRSLKILG